MMGVWLACVILLPQVRHQGCLFLLQRPKKLLLQDLSRIILVREQFQVLPRQEGSLRLWGDLVNIPLDQQRHFALQVR